MDKESATWLVQSSSLKERQIVSSCQEYVGNTLVDIHPSGTPQIHAPPRVLPPLILEQPTEPTWGCLVVPRHSGTPYTRLQRQPLPPIAQTLIVDPEDLDLLPELQELGHGTVELVLEPQRAADVGVGLVQGVVALFQDLAHDGRDVRGVAYAPELVRELHDVVVGREERDGHALELESVFIRSDPAVPLSEAKGSMAAAPLQCSLWAIGCSRAGGRDGERDGEGEGGGINVSLAIRGLIAGDALCHRAEVALGDVRASVLHDLLTVVAVLLFRDRSGLLGELGERGEICRGEDASEAFRATTRDKLLYVGRLRGGRTRHRSRRVGRHRGHRVQRIGGPRIAKVIDSIDSRIRLSPLSRGRGAGAGTGRRRICLSFWARASSSAGSSGAPARSIGRNFIGGRSIACANPISANMGSWSRRCASLVSLRYADMAEVGGKG
ncbi:hypothetical protein PG984_008518 [Apiospora sp. TS-2023a]